MNAFTAHCRKVELSSAELSTAVWTRPAAARDVVATGLTTIAFPRKILSIRLPADFLPKMADSTANITALLRAAASGDRQDVDALMAAIYDDLRRMADSYLRGERHDHTLQPTALAHEAYLKLVDQRSTDWQDRAHFFAIAARILRRILVDHARQKQAVKRGADAQRVSLLDAEIHTSPASIDLVALDEALEQLRSINERQSRIVELRFFGGLTLDEIAEALSLGQRTVDREWKAAKAWLLFALSDEDHDTNQDSSDG